MRGRFITIEGTEGVGKSTNIQWVKDWLVQNNIPFIATREPGGTPLAESLRELLLANRAEAVDATAELLMVFAARAQHLNTIIRPALDSGTWVLSDRFTDATYAYQGCGRGLSLDTITQLENLVQGSLRPDLTLYLDVDVKVGLERARLRGELDRFEQEETAFFERVRQGYLERVAENPHAYAVINAGQDLESVQKDVLEVLNTRLFDKPLFR